MNQESQNVFSPTEGEGERDVLLCQLHMVQEELEHYYTITQESQNVFSPTEGERERDILLCQLHMVQEELGLYYTITRESERNAAYLKRRLDAVSRTMVLRRSILIRLTDKFGITRREQVDSIRASGFFDEKWYLSNYPEVKKKRINAVVHYLRYGARGGINPGPEFDSDWYLATYPDVREKGVNPLLHFVQNGEKEGRKPRLHDFPFPPDPFSIEMQWLKQVSSEQSQLAAERQERIDELTHARNEQAQLAEERQMRIDDLVQAQARLE